MYCGDETGSFVGDIGSCNSRFGYGGADAPSYVVPSRLLYKRKTKQQSEGGSASVSSWNVLTSCHRSRTTSSDNDETIVTTTTTTTPLRTVQEPESQLPLTDPNLYLSQGDSIYDWDAYQNLWENAFSTLRVSDTLKHTVGGREEPNNNTNATAAGGVTSKLLRPTSLYDSQCTHPILVVDPGMTHVVGQTDNNDDDDMYRRKQHIKLCELLFETFGATALFVAPAPMLAAFAYGRQTACVVDIGAGGCRVTNIVDGLVLRHSQRRNGRGTDWLSNVAWKAILHDGKVLRPRYQIRNTNHTTTTTTATTQMKGLFHRWAMMDLIYEFRTSEYVAVPPWRNDPTVPFIYENDTEDHESENSDDENDEDNDSNKPKESDTDKNDPMEEEDDNDESKTMMEDPKHYELPDGTLVDLNSRIGKDLCRLPELLFTDATPFGDLTSIEPSSSLSSSVVLEHPTLSNLPLHKLIHSSLAAVSDVDTRKDLASTILLTGGGSMAKHLEQRLGLEMARITSSAYKTKVLASTFEIERTAAAWIGGSILSSLGSFQQLWLSKTEYEEYGATLAIQRFP
jgi:actin-related protein